MPQCPNCNTAVWVGQKYCTTCDHPLPQSQPEDHSCPQCGLRLSGPQEICQKCDDTPGEMTKILLAAPSRTRGFPLGRRGICLGAGLIIFALSWFFFFDKNPEPRRQVVTPPPQSASEPAPDAPKVPAPETAPATPKVAAAPAPAAPKVAAVPAPAAPPAPAVSSAPEATAPTPTLPRYLVNIDGLYVRHGPDMSEPRIATLKYQDEVELLETSGGWGKVRDVQRDIVGWSYMRYLQPVDPAGPGTISQHRPPIPQEPEAISAKASQNM